jgi:hypothetical protein
MKTVFDLELFLKRGYGIDLDYEDGKFFVDIYEENPDYDHDMRGGSRLLYYRAQGSRGLSETIQAAFDEMQRQKEGR